MKHLLALLLLVACQSGSHSLGAASPGGTDNPTYTSVTVNGAPGVFQGSGCTTYPGGGTVCGNNKGGVSIALPDGGTLNSAVNSLGVSSVALTAPQFTSGIPLGGFYGGGAIGPPFICLAPQSDGGCASFLTAVPADGGVIAGSAEICSSNGVYPLGCMIVESTVSGANIGGNINDYIGNNYCDPSLNTCILPTSTESQLQIGATAPYTFTNSVQYFGTLSGNEIGSALTYGTPPIQNGCEWDLKGSVGNTAIIRAFNPDGGPCSLHIQSYPSPITLDSPIVASSGETVTGGAAIDLADAGILLANGGLPVPTLANIDGGASPVNPVCVIGWIPSGVTKLHGHTFASTPYGGCLQDSAVAAAATCTTTTVVGAATANCTYLCCGN